MTTHRRYNRRERLLAHKRLQADPTLAEHGSDSTYVNWLCRCTDCTTAWSEACLARKERRVAKLAVDPTIVVHGRTTTYGNWGCRCDPCRDAYNKYRRTGVYT